MQILKKYTIIGIIYTIIAGTLLHFVYEWSGSNWFVGLFAPVSESTWEHMKLLFFPYLSFAVYEYYTLPISYHNYCTAKALGVLSGIITIPILFYIYTALLKTNYLILDILIFVISVIVAYCIDLYILKHPNINNRVVALRIIILISLMFFIFTFFPPAIFIFKNPL